MIKEPTAIDKLLERGKLTLHYMHNKYGCNVIMLLPNRNNYGEKERNYSMLSMANNHNRSMILEQYFKKNSENPFLVVGDNIKECIDVMNFNCIPMMYGEQLTVQFGNESEKFRKFIEVCHDVVEEDIYFVEEQVLMSGWESYYEYKRMGDKHD